MYFLRGSLPWQGLKAATNKQKYEKIGEKKQTTPIKELCEGFPEEFGIYLNYVRKLGFEETPDYDFLRELFSKVLKSNGDQDDGVFDWNLLNGTMLVCLYKHPSKPSLFRRQGLGSISSKCHDRHAQCGCLYFLRTRDRPMLGRMLAWRQLPGKHGRTADAYRNKVDLYHRHLLSSGMARSSARSQPLSLPAAAYQDR